MKVRVYIIIAGLIITIIGFIALVYYMKSFETEPVETEPVETEPVESKPVEPEPVESKPVEPEPVESEKLKDHNEFMQRL